MAGGYPITASGAVDGNYTITYAAGTLTITPAPLTITAANATASFGGAVPPLTANYAGLVAGDTPTSLTTPVHLATSATDNSPAGAYPITASGASSPNYTIHYVNGTLTVAPPVTPATAAARSAYGFVTTLYVEILGRMPEPLGFYYWTGRRLHGFSSRSIWLGIARSPERNNLEQEGRAPTIPLNVAYNDALRAGRQAAKLTMVAPAGPLALRKPSHARASTGGVHYGGHARPRGAGRA